MCDYMLSTALPEMILVLSHATSKAAPLITVGALACVPSIPICTKEFIYFNPFDLTHRTIDVAKRPFTVMWIKIFNWISSSQQAFYKNGAAAITVLLVMRALMNSIAITFKGNIARSLCQISFQ